MGFQEYRKFKRLSGWSQTSEECECPARRRAPIKTYRVALIREPHQPVKGQVIVCARSPRNSPSKVNRERRIQPSPPALFKEITELCGLGNDNKKKCWKKIVHRRRQMDRQVPRSRAPGPLISAPPQQQPVREEDSAAWEDAGSSRHGISPWFPLCN